jgi:hypothetical protein
MREPSTSLALLRGRQYHQAEISGEAACTTRQSTPTPKGVRSLRSHLFLGACYFYVRRHMKYADGTTIEPGDVVRIDGQYSGRVLASMDTSQYLPGHEQWAYLREGIMVDTSFAGLVHYKEDASDDFELVERGAA